MCRWGSAMRDDCSQIQVKISDNFDPQQAAQFEFGQGWSSGSRLQPIWNINGQVLGWCAVQLQLQKGANHWIAETVANYFKVGIPWGAWCQRGISLLQKGNGILNYYTSRPLLNCREIQATNGRTSGRTFWIKHFNKIGEWGSTNSATWPLIEASAEGAPLVQHVESNFIDSFIELAN